MRDSITKIEGRYKDMGYVKNITAHYRLLLDEILSVAQSTTVPQVADHKSHLRLTLIRLFSPWLHHVFRQWSSGKYRCL